MTKYKSFSSSFAKAELLSNGTVTSSATSSSTATATSDSKSDAALRSVSTSIDIAQSLAYYEVTKKVSLKNTFASSDTSSSTSGETVSYSNSSTTITNPVQSNINWVNTSSTLQYNNGTTSYPVKLTGFSVTHVENYAGYNVMYTTGAQPNDDCLVYFNYYNNYVYSNLVNLANIIYAETSSNYNNFNNLSSTSITNNIPAVRIPLNADYWLNGSGNSSTIYNNMGVNMTSTQYQNMIISMVYYLMNPKSNGVTTFTGTANGCVIILDLHWNYSDNNQESASYNSSNPQSTPPGQCAMAVASNSIAFWNSICSVFGVDVSGNEFNSTTCLINTSSNSTTINSGSSYTLTSAMKNNIFFELYNEPYLDQINANTGSGYVSYSDYDNQFNLYIQGSEYYTGNPIQDPNNNYYEYNTVGMGTLYDNIRITNNCYNVIVLGGAEGYAYFAGYNYIAYGDTGYPNNFIYNTYGSGSSCYNCWTQLNNAIISGIIPEMDASGTLITNSSNTISTYSNNSNGLESVLANMHPYANGYEKFPGYMYNTSNSDTSSTPNNGNGNPCLANFLQALQEGTNPYYVSFTSPSSSGTENCSDFQISFPIISTEFGMYNLPWIDSSGTTYTSLYNTNPNNASQGVAANWTGVETTIGSYNYWGQYYDENGVSTYSPLITGYFENFNTFNISYTIWALAPNVNAFNQNSILQVNYSATSQNTEYMPLLQDSNINTTTPGQNAFDMDFCFQRYYLGVSGEITE
jgi:hypothetical protein